jgi:hypothetical protein
MWWRSNLQIVMRGLDPRIHRLRKSLAKRMDCRLKPPMTSLVYNRLMLVTWLPAALMRAMASRVFSTAVAM